MNLASYSVGHSEGIDIHSHAFLHDLLLLLGNPGGLTVVEESAFGLGELLGLLPDGSALD